MTTDSYAAALRHLAEKASARESFEPWLFFPRGWDWPWLSFEEGQACVEAWTGDLAGLFGSDETAALLHCSESAPETLLLRLAVCSVNGGNSETANAKTDIQMVSGAAEPLVGETRSATFQFQSSPIRPRLEIEVEYGWVEPGEVVRKGDSSTLDSAPLDSALLDLAGSRRQVVLATGVLPPAPLLASILRSNAALVLEPASAGLVGDLRLQPTVLFLRSGESESLFATLKVPLKGSGPSLNRSQKRLRAATAGVRLVIVEDPLDRDRLAKLDSWNPEVVELVSSQGTGRPSTGR